MPYPRQQKGVLEWRWYAFNFSQYPEIRDFKESIVSVVVASITGNDTTLLCTNTAPLDKDGNGKNERAAVKLQGGTSGVIYTLAVTATTDAGNVLEGIGTLVVVD